MAQSFYSQYTPIYLLKKPIHSDLFLNVYPNITQIVKESRNNPFLSQSQNRTDEANVF